MNPPPDLTPAQRTELLDKHLHVLMEHFEHVQILATTETPSGTEYFARGRGNWYARQGMASEFIHADQAATEANEMKRVLAPVNPPPPDDGEEWKA